MARLKKFTDYADGLFPSEIAYIKAHNAYEDQKLIDILDIASDRVAMEKEQRDFDTEIDPRKYSKLIKSIDKKLEEIDVDKYFEWISRVDHMITIDSIPAEEQARILKEMQLFEPGWFHMESFYGLLQNYEGYLLRRFRESDYDLVKAFNRKHFATFSAQRKMDSRVAEITEQIVFRDGRVASKELHWLLQVFRDQEISKKIRYHALLAFMMYYINRKETDALIEPMQELEGAIFNGEFYSRRILANFYANKLIVLRWQRSYEAAAYCGLQSIKYKTEDYLYYLNNYVSVLFHLSRTDEALTKMQEMFVDYKSSRDLGRKIVFITNYCRCLNLENRYAKSASLARSFLDEQGKRILKRGWHYFFRTYFFALLKCDETERIVRLSRKYKLTDREVKEGFDPHIRALVLAAEYREIKLSQREFIAGIDALHEPQRNGENEFLQLLDMMKTDFSAE